MPPKSSSILSAYLLKQSAGKWKRKRWNQRWVVLDKDSGVLRYFRHASPLEAVPLRQDAHGVVNLKQAGVTLVVQGDLPQGVPTPFCFTVSAEGHKELRLCADTNADFRQWTVAISAIISPSRAPRADAKVSPTKASSSAESSAPSPAPATVKEVTEVIKTQEQQGTKVVEPRELVAQVRGLVAGDKRLVLALNPVILLVRFGDASSWYLIALLANALCVWLLWVRTVETRVKPITPRSPTRRSGANVVTNGKAEAPRDQSSSKLKCAEPRDRATSSAADDAAPKAAAFSGEVNGVKAAAGDSLQMCAPAPADIVRGCWAQIDATRFNVRQGPNYRRTKLKAASASALLELVAVDVYQSTAKVDNVGSIVDLSKLKPPTGELDLFIVNCQVPSYQPSNPLWGEKQGDGPGFNFVTYFAVPPAIREMLDLSEPSLQAVRLLKDFMQHPSWVSERFKAIGIVVNPQEQRLGRAERHLLETYNGQPILTRPQHRFYRGNGYFEVDVNAHDFNYVARKGLVGVSDHACNMVLDFGFVLEGQEDHELPEQILGSVRLCQVDVRQAPHLT